jgi:transcriptional regulator with XRE-family HTH domain
MTSRNFGQCFRAILRQKNLTQMQAAELLSVSQNTISYYCNAKNPPRAHVLSHMAVKLGVSEGELLGERSGAL